MKNLIKYYWLVLLFIYSSNITQAADEGAGSASAALKKINGNVGATLPKGDIAEKLIPTAISFILALFGIVLTGVIIYAGVLYIARQGEEDTSTQARKLLLNAMFGLAAVAIAYGVVYAVTQFDFN